MKDALQTDAAESLAAKKKMKKGFHIYEECNFLMQSPSKRGTDAT